jgi:hypothetical protein
MEEDLGFSVKVIGTSPLSFELHLGDKILVKRYISGGSKGPKPGPKCRTDAYILYRGVTKIGKLSDTSIKKLEGNIPEECTVSKVDPEKNILMVLFRPT